MGRGEAARFIGAIIMMGLAIAHLILASIGVGATVLTALLVRRLVGNDPIVGYRVLLAFLLVALLVLPLQLVASEFAPTWLREIRSRTVEQSGPAQWVIWLGGVEIAPNSAIGPGAAHVNISNGGSSSA